MTDLRKAAEMALEALDEINKLSIGENAICLPAEIDDAMEALRQALAQPESDCKPDFDLLFEANSADIEALTDAQFTLEAIKSADPGTHDEIIDASLRLIKVALSKSVFGPIERIAERIGVEI
jgi:hypothetical protein